MGTRTPARRQKALKPIFAVIHRPVPVMYFSACYERTWYGPPKVLVAKPGQKIIETDGFGRVVVPI